MSNDKTNFNMQLTTTQKQIMDFVTEVVFEGYNYSKADMVSLFFKNNAIEYLHLGIEPHSISDEMLLALLLDEKKTKDLDLVSIIGVEQFEKLIADAKGKGMDTTYNEELIKEYKLKKGEK